MTFSVITMTDPLSIIWIQDQKYCLQVIPQSLCHQSTLPKVTILETSSLASVSSQNLWGDMPSRLKPYKFTIQWCSEAVNPENLQHPSMAEKKKYIALEALQWWVNPSKYSGYYMYHLPYCSRPCIFPTQCIYMFHMILTINFVISMNDITQFVFIIETVWFLWGKAR
jgi:hypothetical protein